MIRKLLTITLLTLLTLSNTFAQPDDASWVNVTVQTDNYGGESSWEILNSDNIAVAVSPPLQNNTLINIMVFLPAGEYVFVMYDSFGDGICCSFGQGFFGLTNTCGLEEFNYEFDSAIDSIPFVLEPCLPILLGCMNEAADNYNPWANQDDGSCEIVDCDSLETQVSMELTLDTWPSETGFTLVNIANGQPYEQVIPGEFNFGDQLVTYTYDFCVSLGFELVLVDEYGDGLNGSASGGEDGACVITACGDSVLWELEDLAFTEFDDGNTMYSGAIFTEPCPPVPPIVGCMDDDYIDYNPDATAQDTCMTLHTWGCTDPEAMNYDSTATIDDLNSPCSIQIILEDDAGDGWGMSGIGMKQGDQQWLFTVGPGVFSESWDIMLDSDEEVDIYYFQDGGQQSSAQELAFQTLHNSVYAINQDGDTLLSEGSNPFLNNGQSALQPFSTPEWKVYHFTPYCGDSCIPYVYGCTDNAACNYDPEANTNVDCNYPVQYYDCNNSCVNDYDGDGVCDELEVVGCQDPTAFNYNSAATDPGECIPVIFGCTDPTQFNYNPDANTENGNCIPFIYGCMNPDAFNYNPDANTELEDSCIEVVVDCMDPNAFNYNELANTPNEEACLYDAGCITGPGVPYWYNDGCYAWIIDIDPYCCEVGWDDTCAELYSYCEQGWPQGVYDIHDVYNVYPNPVNNILYIQSPINTETVIYNSLGQVVISSTKEKRIDMTHLPNGIYNVVINHINKIIIKS
tara:strand:+ start:17154 stop:19373 length:2220 start_codon:yes stop_codon:yes gene_type:complete